MNNFRLKILLLIFSHLFITFVLFGTIPPPIIINDTTTHYLLDSHFALLKDQEKKLTIRDIISPAFQQKFIYNEEQKLNFGHINAAYWLKFVIKNNTNHKKDLLLKIDYQINDKIDLYIPQKNNTFIVKKSGDQIPFQQREIHHRKPLFKLTLNAHQQQTYYLKAENNGGTLSLPISFLLPESQIQIDYIEQYFLGIYYGILIIVSLINLFLFRTLFDKIYLYYALYIFSLSITQFTMDGLAFQYLWPNSTWLANHIIPIIICLSYSFFILFTKSFLHTKYYLPKLDKLLTILLALFIAILLLSLVNDWLYGLSTQLLDYMNFIIGALIFTVAIASLKTNFRVNVYFLAGFIIALMGISVFVLKDIGILPSFFLTDYAAHLGTSFEAIVLSFALAVRFKILKEEKEIAQIETVKQLTKINKFKDQLNKQLEQIVKERTEELRTINDELRMMNTELNSSKAEIEQTNIKLNVVNTELEQKNEAITDSIHYAKKIQAAIMPPIEKVRNILPNSFILYKPRDIVSGDFYWFFKVTSDGERGTKAGNQQIIIAACDCTGHGVPGAFMSMICNTLLNETVKDKRIVQPNLILDRLHKSLVTELRQSEDESNVSDGMDIALCSLSFEFETVSGLEVKEQGTESRGQGEKGFERREPRQLAGPSSMRHIVLQYAGAYRPLFLVRNGKLSEIKGDRFSVGGFQTERKHKFTNHTLDIQKGDSIYIFTDGFADQFGGTNDKRFMVKRFKEILQEIQDVNIREQGKILNETIEKWQGKEEQTDDILVIGMKF